MGIFDFKKKKPAAEVLSKQLKAVTETEDFDDPYSRLAAEIVVGAISDWRMLIKRKAWTGKTSATLNNIVVSFDELRGFFNGGWCEFLMQDFGMTPARILQLLEEELRQAIIEFERK